MNKYNMITPEGTSDVLFGECIERRAVQKSITEIFLKKGYNEVITPGIEYYDVFDVDGAGIPQHEMYKATDNKGRLVVFRPDLTLPIARLTATRLQDMPLPIRLFYNQSVYRNRPDLTGRSDESSQCGIELIGAGGLRADLEALSTAVESISSVAGNFRIELGHADIYRILSDKLGVSNEVKENIRGIIESKNYGALSDMLDKLENSVYVEAIRRLPRLFGGREVFAEAAGLCDDEEFNAVLQYLESIYTSLQKLGLGGRIMVDLGLVQRNGYYTGIVFSAYAEGHGDAVLMGGRYDSLLEKFNNPMPAVGFAIDVDAVTKINLENKGSQSPEVPRVLIHTDKGFEIDGQIFAAKLISRGVMCETSVFEGYADSEAYAKGKGIEKIILLGENGCDAEGCF